MTTLFSEIGLVIILATGLAFVARLFKQPPLIGYIITGLILGPLGVRSLGNPELFKALEEIGLALVLFLVGMEMDWQKAKHQLKTVSALGFIQVVVSFATALALAILFHQSLITGIYLGTALAFASTIVVVKVLSEGKDLNSLYGRLAVGILLLQDVLAITAITLIGGLTEASRLSVPSVLLLLLIKMIAILTLTWVCAQYILPPIFARVARSSELLFLFSLAWCFIFTLSLAQYGIALGTSALLAGVSLASLPYNLEIHSRLRSLRDFFVILFFVVLGSSAAYSSLSDWVFTSSLVVLVTIGKPIITFFILIFRGFTSRVSFMTALTQGQISEYALPLIAVGLTSGQVSESFASSISIVSIISICISTVLLTQRNQLYNHLRGILRHFEHTRAHLSSNLKEDALSNHIIIFGYHRMGYHILKKLRTFNKNVLVVDSNPDIIKKLMEENIPCIYGEVQDEDLLEQVGAYRASMVISTIPHHEETSFLLEKMGKHNKEALVIVTTHSVDEALEYYKQKASYVVLPHLLGGEHVAEIISNYEEKQKGELLRHRAEEIKLLRTKNNSLYYD